MREIQVNTPTMSGKNYVGEEVLGQRLPILTSGQKNFVVTDSNVYALYPDFFKSYFKDTAIFVLPAGEEHKTFQSLYEILTKMAESGLRRTSRLFAVGGGVVGDIGGLAAALYMRGISCVQIPTTLLAQVDSSVGGKTAVDLAGIKNIVGAFYQPCEVLVCPEFLKTLPKRELKCGLGEIVKYTALNGEMLDIFENYDGDLDDLSFLSSLIYPSICIKTRVVQADEKETGERKCLNVGHTTGHAIELAYGFSHGEGVLYGMALETAVAMEYGVCERAYGEKLLAIIRRALRIQPVTAPDFSKLSETLGKAKADKKNKDGDGICMAVAKEKGVWTELVLSYPDYEKAIIKAAQCI